MTVKLPNTEGVLKVEDIQFCIDFVIEITVIQQEIGFNIDGC